ncbi:DEAD/DEAH box helicase [Myxococcus xanthus]|uniref:DEAD/DEAH box helicase n=1 Tax=Myxococcus xanthus TaxID=34 RepID=UPI001128EF66|nr:DEAD/DEAH box helicase family protein [Myxococcus xanthus]
MSNPFQEFELQLDGNVYVRTPQKEAYQKLVEYASGLMGEDREVGIVLPVGCGKSGCIALAPFAFGARRVLVVAPGLAIAKQLARDFDSSRDEMFYKKCQVLPQGPYPEPVYIQGDTVNRSDLEEAHVVVTNIQQLQGGENNRWLRGLSNDFFDLILFDEGHHSVADSWTMLKQKFSGASIVNFSATPLRADGQVMAGKVLYSYSIFRAIQDGYVKRLRALQLNPRTLKYVRREDGREIEVSLDDVRRLGEQDADFRRSIVTSSETLNTIVDASIRELDRLKEESGESRLKIIASALNFEHCRQIVEAYRARGRNADYVHSLEGGAANERVMNKLERHQIEVIVQVRKLGEGFDHTFLAVAAVFSVFSNLSPFVQFVGRIMRVVKQNAPLDAVNQGVVVFHAGANIANRWSDFQAFTGADQSYFDQLLPLEGLDPGDPRPEREIVPVLGDDGSEIEIRAQTDVHLEEIPLLRDDVALEALRTLRQRGYTSQDIAAAFHQLNPTADEPLRDLKPVSTTRVRERQAKRSGLDMRAKSAAARVLGERGLNPEGRELDTRRIGRSNLVVVKAAIDSAINAAVGRGPNQRNELSRAELDKIEKEFDGLVAAAVSEVFDGSR